MRTLIMRTSPPSSATVNAGVPATCRHDSNRSSCRSTWTCDVKRCNPRRKHGLFPSGDALLRELAAQPRCHPFEKHMSGGGGSHLPCPLGGWTTGNAACRAGLDLRMFHRVPSTRPSFLLQRALYC